MKTITIFLWCLVGLVLGTVVALGQNPTPIANLQRATTVYTTNIIPVVTNPGQTNGTKGIELDDFLASLVGFPGWPSVSVTNAIGTVKTNGATLTASATSINFVQGSNTVLRATNSAGAVSIEINAAASGSASVNTNLQLQSLKVFGNQTNVGNLAFGTNYYWTDSGVNTLQLVDPKRGGAALTFEGSDGGITFGINATATPYIDVVAPLNVYESFNLPGHNVAVGRVWTATNASTGAGEWQAVGGGGGGSGTDLHVFTNGALALISTNINFQTGITGAVSGTTVNLGIDSRALNWAVVASTTNANGISNYVGSVSNLVNTKQHGTAILTNISGTGAITNLNWSVIASVTNVNGVSNYVGSVSNALWAGDNSVSNYVGSVSNLTQTKQAGNAVLTNLVGTVARNVTNVVSLSTSNATSKPLSNSYATGTLTLFGLEAGANVTITPNASNLVIAATSGGSVSATNVPNLTVTNAINEVEYSPTSSGTNLTIDLARSGNIAVTLTTNVHILFTNVQSGVKASRLKLSQDATGGWSVLSATVSGGLLRTNGNPWQFMGTTAGDEAHWWFGTSQATNVWIYQEASYAELVEATNNLQNAGVQGPSFTPNFGAVFSSYGASTNWSPVNGGWVMIEEFWGDTRLVTSGALNHFGSSPWWVLISGTLPGGNANPINLGSEVGMVPLITTQATSSILIYSGQSSSAGLGGLYLTNADTFAVFGFSVGQTNDAAEIGTFTFGLGDNKGSSSATVSANNQIAFQINTNATNTLICKTARSSTATSTYTATQYSPVTRYFGGIYVSRWVTNAIFYFGTNMTSLIPIATNSANIPLPTTALDPFFLSGRMTTTSGAVRNTNFPCSVYIWRKTYD